MTPPKFACRRSPVISPSHAEEGPRAHSRRNHRPAVVAKRGLGRDPAGSVEYHAPPQLCQLSSRDCSEGAG